VQEQFLTDFGMSRTARTDNALYMRGTDPEHHLHVTEKGEPGFIGLAYYVDSEETLKEAAKVGGATGVENVDEPGGGKRVRLREPNGYLIELLHGVEKLKPIPVEHNAMNWREHHGSRAGEEKRLKKGPSRVKRIGHAVMAVPDLKNTYAWFTKHLGIVPSDKLYAGDTENVVAAFGRLDRGDDFVDHHVIFMTKGEKAGLNHIGYEVQDIDDLALGHDYLKSKPNYEHVWGIGRHLSGSQVFDYWFDPYKRIHEHWTDTDLLNTKNEEKVMPISELRSQWGQPAPEVFKKHVSSSKSAAGSPHLLLPATWIDANR
jgi:catechol 2,3-dioxygenase-like lactoylglutathione lyase family enzyme